MSMTLCGNSQDKASFSGEIDHCEELSKNIGNLVLQDDYSDVTFVVEEKKFPAHRVILAARCSYFRALLYGGMKEAEMNIEIVISDTSADAFETLLKYIYTGKMKISTTNDEDILDILGLANKYGFPALESALSTHLLSNLTAENVCILYDVAILYSLPELQGGTAEFIDKNALDILKSDSFLRMSLDGVQSILKRDSLCVPEKIIFKSVQDWCAKNCLTTSSDDTSPEEKEAKLKYLESLLAVVRLPLIPLHDLFYVVRPSGLVSPDSLLDAIKAQSESCDRDLPYRGVLYPDENIATAHHGAQVVEGDMCASLLDGDSRSYDGDHGFTIHNINDDASNKKERCIKVKLGCPSIINNIRMLLWDKDGRSYSYYVEVSMDDKDWNKVIDYSKHLCRSWQNLYFRKRVVRYIRVVGTHSSINKMFHLVVLEAMFSTDTVDLIGDLVVAQANVAKVDVSACIIEGVSRDRNALINGDISTYDWDSGYTCHQLGNGAITVQLAQPYIIRSMRLLLWDIDDRTYSYYIQVSCDNENWTVVVDKRNAHCQSWQTLEFNKIAATFIKIIGTANTANEVFHCVHFECPASTIEVGSGDPASRNPVAEVLLSSDSE